MVDCSLSTHSPPTCSLPKTQARLHAANTPVNDQAEGGPIYNTMVASGDFCANSTDLFALLLVKYGIHVQIYSSSNDPLLGPPTTEAAINAMMHKAAEVPLGGGGGGLMQKKLTRFRTDCRQQQDCPAVDQCPAHRVERSPAAQRLCVVLSVRCQRCPLLLSRYEAVRWPPILAHSLSDSQCWPHVAKAIARGLFRGLVVLHNSLFDLSSFQPRAALDMTQRFIKGVSFAGPGLPLPNCAQCGGSPPFTGSALCECHVD